MHAVAVEFDFVQPLGPVGRLVDELGELRPYPLRQTGRVVRERRTARRAMPGAGRGYGAGAWASLRLGKLRRAAIAVSCQFR
jgi:hypothetical protein